MAGMPLFQKLILLAVTVLSISLLTTGCETYRQKNKVIVYWRAGDLARAQAEAVKRADKNAGGKDAIIWRLEEGATLRAVGKYQESNKAFDQAQTKMDDYAQMAKVRLGQEAAALLSNQANLAYEGRSYDGIMLNTYEALNYLALGEPEKARPELIHAYQRQQEAVEDNRRRIEKTQAEAAKNKDNAMIDQAEQDPKFQGRDAEFDEGHRQHPRLCRLRQSRSPFIWTDCFSWPMPTDASDLERAHKSFERVAGLDRLQRIRAGRNLTMVNDLMNGKPLPPTTYVIFETGCAPIRDQIRIDIPIISANVSYVGAAFPTLVPQGDFLPC